MKKNKGKFFVPNQGSLEGPPEQIEEPVFSGKELNGSDPLWEDIGRPIWALEATNSVVSDSGVSEEFKGVERLW
ncbi:hypothetical protein KJ853_00615 [Patescibacteria group bacterium]|nr:hypothetical protein [Patescibacteria group bacterium]